MKILLISQYFHPENFKCNDVAFELAKRGHEVTVLTDIPNYPGGKFYKGYGLFHKRKEYLNGVKIIRTWVIPRGNGGAIRLALNYFSFAFFASIRVFFMSLFHKYDAILVHETSPITVGIPAVLAKKMQRIPMLFWVLDLWPESLSAAGGITNKYILGFFTQMTKWIYNNSNRILISSKGFRKSILEKGNYEKKLVYFPNWADAALLNETSYQLPSIPNGFIVMFAGNIGEAQDFDHLMEAAHILKEEKDIHFVFVGDGRKRGWVEEYIKNNNLTNTVHWVGRHPLEAMPAFFNKANVMLVSLKDELIFNLTAPAKIQAYMSAGKPILAMMNGEGPRIIEEAKCGYSVAAGDAKELAKKIKYMHSLAHDELKNMGENGKAFCNMHFELQKCIDHLHSILKDEIK